MIFFLGLRAERRNTRLYMYTPRGWFGKEHPGPLRGRGCQVICSKFVLICVSAAPVLVATLHTVCEQLINKDKQLGIETLPREKSTRTDGQHANPN